MVISCDSTAALHFFIQDPVYGKGKLGEIQGLVLGMLDTFNYEQVSCLCFCSVHHCMQHHFSCLAYCSFSLLFVISVCRAKSVGM